MYRLVKNISRQNMKKGINVITQSEALAPEEIEVHKHQRYLSALSESTVETALTVGTRSSAALGKLVPKKKKYI